MMCIGWFISIYCEPHNICLVWCQCNYNFFKKNKEKTPYKGRREEKRKDQSPNKRPHPKVQIEHTMGSPKRRKHEIKDLNPSPATQSKSCKEMGENPRRTPSLELLSNKGDQQLSSSKDWNFQPSLELFFWFQVDCSHIYLRQKLN